GVTALRDATAGVGEDPGAGVDAGEYAHRDAWGQPVALTTGGRHELRGGNALLAHDPAAFVGADDLGAGVGRDDLGAGDVIEVAVSDEHIVRLRDVFRAEADRRRGRHAVHV